ncbi:alpha-galactosidase [Diaminobutyricimonas aerilata]|nr:alpha-galactosidase [Diaminobutyricimonas aerilata]
MTKDSMPHDTPPAVHLRAAGVSLVLDLGRDVPTVLHWGPDLGALPATALSALVATSATALLHNSPDVPRVFSLLPGEFENWSGTPALTGHRAGEALTPRWRRTSVEVQADGGAGGSVALGLDDPASGLALELVVTLGAEGLVRIRQSFRSTAPVDAADLDLASVVTLLPVPSRGQEVLDFTGKWSRERQPQRTPLVDGTHARRVRRGKPGVDSPYLLAVGTPAFGARTGEVWAAHVAWSGDAEWLVERLPEGAGAFSAALGGGELLRAGEVRLAAGERYESPEVVYAYSSTGLDGIADRFHAALRADRRRPGAQPLVLNTWEAVYFDHDLARLTELVDRAASVGVERIVLDDGWFRGRRDDHAGLGDWQVDAGVWPEGLDPFVERVRAHGMQFGLWFEPEMINLDSELARRHPEWILGPTAGLAAPSRHQYVLDIAHPEAFEYLYDSIAELVERHRIDFLKWDHNRDLAEAVRRTAGGRAGVHEQTLALYALLDRLRERFPTLEIESCASGGGRVDLGVLARTDRVWTSDCNDPIERQRIQRWSELLLPPELLGSHVGAARSHTTNRMSDLSFRLATTLFASAGIEWDITTCSADELDRLRAWADLYKEVRELVATGRRVHADLADDQTLLHGSVAADGSRALYAWARLDTSPAGQAGRVPFPGLDRGRDYRMRVRRELGDVSLHQGAGPEWLESADADGVVLPGVVLGEVGVPLPTLNAGQALVFDLVAV